MEYRGSAATSRPAGIMRAALPVAVGVEQRLLPELRADARAQRIPHCPELDCVRHFLPPAVLLAAEERAARVGVGADRVLVTAGLVSEETYLAALALSLELPFGSLEEIERTACPLSNDRLVEGATMGLLPLRILGQLTWVIAPRGIAARRIVTLIQSQPALARRFRVATPEQLRNFVTRHCEATIVHRVVDALKMTVPAFSAGVRTPPSKVVLASIAGLAIGAVAAPVGMAKAGGIVLAIFFLAWTALRLVSTLMPQRVERSAGRLPDDQLPIYTIMIPLYEETAALEGLMHALRQLDYPPEKLDIKLILELHDRATRAAIDRMSLTTPFEVVIAPVRGPRTKPKALNAGLASARGVFTTIYDAEDRPEPNQLRLALDTFLEGDRSLACVQARLTIDNTDDNWLARLFTAEYAGLFDVFLPAIAARRLPVPLGGSSNHFRGIR